METNAQADSSSVLPWVVGGLALLGAGGAGYVYVSNQKAEQQRLQFEAEARARQAEAQAAALATQVRTAQPAAASGGGGGNSIEKVATDALKVVNTIATGAKAVVGILSGIKF